MCLCLWGEARDTSLSSFYPFWARSVEMSHWSVGEWSSSFSVPLLSSDFQGGVDFSDPGFLFSLSWILAFFPNS